MQGDYDGDGDVDGRDFLAWQRNPAIGSLADWQTNYGAGYLTALAAVPEPTALAILIACSLAAITNRRTLNNPTNTQTCR